MIEFILGVFVGGVVCTIFPVVPDKFRAMIAKLRKGGEGRDV